MLDHSNTQQTFTYSNSTIDILEQGGQCIQSKKSERTASQIAKSKIDLSISLKKNENMIAVSGIVTRLDELNNKEGEVNNRLELMPKQRGLPYISHCETIDPDKHLNESNLHLNSYGIRVFAENGVSSTRILNINRERKSMSAENVDVADTPEPANTILKNLRLANVNRLICAQLKINSVRNKFESLKDIVIDL